MKTLIFISLIASALARGCAKMAAKKSHESAQSSSYSASQSKEDAFEMELNEAKERSVKFLEVKFNSTNTSNVYYENGILIMDNTRTP